MIDQSCLLFLSQVILHSYEDFHLFSSPVDVEFQEGTSWCAKGLKSAILYGNPTLGTGHVHGPPGTAASKSISGLRRQKCHVPNVSHTIHVWYIYLHLYTIKINQM